MSITGLIEGHGKLEWLFKPLLQIFSLLHAELSPINAACSCFWPLDKVWASMAWLSLHTLCFFDNHIFPPTLRILQDLISNFNLLASSRNLPCIYSANKIVTWHTAFIYLISHQYLMECCKNICNEKKTHEFLEDTMLGLGLMKYQWSQVLSVWQSACRVSTLNKSFIHQGYHPVFQQSAVKLPGPTACSGVRSWAVQDTFHPLQLLVIRGLHIPQSMATANLILRSIEMTLEGELSAPLGAEVW